MSQFEPITNELTKLINEWEPKLLGLQEEVITKRKNAQNRSIRQIVGHMCDSASNNAHRIIHLQYQKSPLQFPNYASYGNNDRWIAIQNYQEEDWKNLVYLWKYLNLHIIHVMGNVDYTKLDNQWQADADKFISLKDNITEYLPHFRLHLKEIENLADF